MRKLFIKFMALTACLFVSCSQAEIDDADRDISFELLQVGLSPEEFLSIAFEGNEELSTEEVLDKVEQFSTACSENSTRSEIHRSEATIVGSYSLCLDNGGSTDDYGVNPRVNFKVVSFGNKSNKGFAVVCSNRRYPEVLAYLEGCDIKDIESIIGLNPMIQRANQIAVDYVERCKEFEDSLRSSTIKKICDRFQIDASDYSFKRYAYNIRILRDSRFDTSKSYMVVDLSEGILVNKVGPLCGTTNIIQGWPCNQFMAKTDLPGYQTTQHNGHYPAGCVPVALATMCSYLRPTIYCDELKRNINWDYVFDSTFDPYGFDPAEYDPSTPQAIEVGHLLKIIADGTKTTFNGDGGHTTIPNAASYMNKIGINMSSSTTALNYTNVRSSLANKGLVFCLGDIMNLSRSESFAGSHAWVIDGVQIRRPNSRMELQNYNCYASCKFGWSDSSYAPMYNGWYLFDTTGTITFEFGNQSASRNLKCIPNIKKK